MGSDAASFFNDDLLLRGNIALLATVVDAVGARLGDDARNRLIAALAACLWTGRGEGG